MGGDIGVEREGEREILGVYTAALWGGNEMGVGFELPGCIHAAVW